MIKKYKIFVGPHEIAGYYKNLAHGLSQIGHTCDFFTYNRHKFKYGGNNEKDFFIRCIFIVRSFKSNISSFYLNKFLNLFIVIFQVLFSIRVIYKYDVFIFGFGKSLLPLNLDLVLLKFFKKKVISVLSHGSEARPPYMDGAILSMNEYFSSPLKLVNRTLSIKKCVNFHHKYSNLVVGAPYTNHFFSPSKFINSLCLGVPFHSPKSSNNTKIESRTLRVLHSPSNTSVKGTKVIYKAIKNLINKGYAIDFIIIKNKSFDDVVNEIQNCDFVIDQVFSDTPMAGFATEAAWFGKPAIVGGYRLNELKCHIPKTMWPPVKLCIPENIEQVIENFIINIEERIKLGLEAKQFVREKWSSVEVAKRYEKLINNEIPNEWWFDPRSILYVEGGGISNDKLKFTLSRILSSYSLDSLQLSHRPELIRTILDFVAIKSEC